ncbi:MAG: DUF4124 domain-containing protein [Porticoccaceae bacterium]|nr:DUF4124 domain-containing protein [Porticoccaceae bacterium]
MKNLGAALLLTLSLPASGAEVYKCTAPDGKISFSSNPYCGQVQAYAKNRNEPLVEISPAKLAKISTQEKIELHYARVDLADVVEIIGDVAGIAMEPIALEGKIISLNQPPRPWLDTFNDLAVTYNLDYRQAYGKLYVYQLGGMGETIVHSPDLLRWYQSADTWDIVLKNDGILLAMRAYQETDLKERLPNLLRRVREELGEQAHTNAAETVALKRSNAGVSGSIASSGNLDQQSRALAEENAKKRRIIEKRLSNSQQRQQNSQSRCFSSGSGC